MRVLALIVMCAWLAGCGFQLRGEARLPEVMSETRLVAADDTSLFVRELGLLLEANGARVVDQPDVPVLQIFSERVRREPLSISGQARVREYLLIHEVEFELRDADGEILIEREQLRLTRDYSFDEQEILGAQREEEFLRDDLRREMASRLIRRLEAAGRS